MQSLWYLCLLFSFLGSAIAASDLDFTGYIELYSKTQYKRTFAILKITYASQCYSLDCANLDNQAASAEWNLLPNSTSDTLIFYSEADCTGHKASVRLDNGHRRVADLQNMKGTVSSFMVRTKATTSDAIAKRGQSNVCNWVAGAGMYLQDPALPRLL